MVALIYIIGILISTGTSLWVSRFFSKVVTGLEALLVVAGGIV